MTNTFTIYAEDIGTVTLIKPLYAGEDYAISRNLVRFDFWSNHYTVRDDGINIEAITLVGIERIDEGGSACFPLCFPICFANDFLFTQFIKLSNMMKLNKEVQISGLGDNIDGIYIIETFNYRTMHSAFNYAWTITLEWVRRN